MENCVALGSGGGQCLMAVVGGCVALGVVERCIALGTKGYVALGVV